MEEGSQEEADYLYTALALLFFLLVEMSSVVMMSGLMFIYVCVGGIRCCMLCMKKDRNIIKTRNMWSVFSTEYIKKILQHMMWKYDDVRWKKKKIMWHASLATEKNHAHINRCTGGHTYAQKLGGEARLWYQQLILQKSHVFFYFFFFFFFFPEQQWQWRGTREAEWVETDLMRQRDHSLPSDLANIPGASSRLFCWSARPFFSRYGCLLSCFRSQDSQTKKKNASAEAFTL